MREMMKKNRQLPAEEAQTLFAKGHHGTLAVNGDDGYPYAVPVNYIYLDGFIYIHSAKKGYKIDALKKDPKVCFSTILSSEIWEEQTTAKFESVIVTGKVEFVADDAERKRVMETFIQRFTPNCKEIGMAYVEKTLPATQVLKIHVEELKGKAYRG